jgi:xanthine dehydrogenase YagS FAD-binding subunit
MNNFEYANPTSLPAAIGLLASKWGETEILAGGTDLLSLMKEHLSTPKRVVNIKNVAGLNQIRAGDESVAIGAVVTLQELIDNEYLRRAFPSLVQAAQGVTSPQIRSFGTVAGDLCQRPRCWYYRAGFGLLATGPDGKPLVPRGDNRYHAIFGGGPALFVCPSSLGPALVALGASLTLVGPKGERQVPVARFFTTPQGANDRENVLAPNEILASVNIPKAAVANATYEVRQREALDWPLATASVAVKLSGKTVSSAAIVLGHVAPTPHRSGAAEAALKGQAITEATAEAAGRAAAEGAKPLSQNGYKVRLVQTAVKRALLLAGAV